MDRVGDSRRDGALSSSSWEAECPCAEGYDLLGTQQFDRANKAIEHARSLAPPDPIVRHRLGLLFSDTGRLADASLCFDAALQLDSDYVRPHNNSGSAPLILGRLDEAEVTFRHAMDLAPDAEPPYLILGQMLFNGNTKCEAIALFRSSPGHLLRTDSICFNNVLEILMQSPPSQWCPIAHTPRSQVLH